MQNISAMRRFGYQSNLDGPQGYSDGKAIYNPTAVQAAMDTMENK